MKNILKDGLKITNNCIILTIPLIFFVKIIDLYSMYSKYHIDSALKFFIASLTVIFMFCIFCSSWFCMVKDAVKLSGKIFVLDKDRAHATLKLFKSLLDGVGKYFLSFLGAGAIYILIIQLLATQLVYLIGSNVIGGLEPSSIEGIQTAGIAAAASNTSSMALMLDNMTPEMITYFAKWSLLFIGVTFIITYFLMLWIPEIVYGTLNPLKALVSSINKLLHNFFETFGLYVALWLSGFVILFVNTFSIINPFAYLFMSIVMFYFFTYFVVTIFLYYDKKFDQEKQ